MFHSGEEQTALAISLQIQDVQYLMRLKIGSHNRKLLWNLQLGIYHCWEMAMPLGSAELIASHMLTFGDHIFSIQSHLVGSCDLI